MEIKAMDFQYTMLYEIGKGAYGCVWKAMENDTKKIVAIKQLMNTSMTKDYDNIVKLQEVEALVTLKDHPNIIKLKEVIKQDDKLFYVFEFMKENLLEMIKNRTSPLLEREIQLWMYQILQAVAYMHSKGYVHRDIKPENILVNEGTLKLADFGLSKKMCHCLNDTNVHIYNLEHVKKEGCSYGYATTYMCTRWYRAPEIILGSPFYSAAVDMWSIGVTMAEMFRSLPIFYGRSEANQLDQISALLGAPNYQTWPKGCKLAAKCNFSFKNLLPIVDFAKCIPNASYEALDLIQSLMAWNPHKRPTALQALKHSFFKNKQTFNQDMYTTQFRSGSKIIRQPAWYNKAHYMTCAMEDTQYFAHNTLYPCFLSSYQQACYLIELNSIAH